MITAVIPAQNEEGRILKVIESVTHSGIDRILVIVNGSRDKTFTEVLSITNPNVQCFFSGKPWNRCSQSRWSSRIQTAWCRYSCLCGW